MLKRTIATLLCATAPAALFAQEVELRSLDGFISVAGEIVDFNGTMLSVDTSVGAVSVPVSEVGCYGAGCQDILANNNFGLSASDFVEVVSGDTQQDVATAAATPSVAPATSTELSVNFARPEYDALFRAVAGSYAADPGANVAVSQSEADEVLTLSSGATGQDATLRLNGDAASDVNVAMTPLTGTAAADFPDVTGWALTGPLTHQMVGLKAFAVIAAPGAGVTSVSLDDIAAIYAGEISNWSELGGADMRILPLQLPAGSDIRAEFIALIMEPAGKAIAGNVLTMADQASIASSVKQFPGSVSVVDLSSVEDNQVLDVAGSCGRSVAPQSFNIAAGDYPLVRPIMARYNTTPSNSLTPRLLDYASSDAVQTSLLDSGFVDFSASELDGTKSSARLSAMMNAQLSDVAKPAAASMFERLFDARRLSPTLFGGATSGAESGWNRAMFQTLAETLSDDTYGGRNVFFVGVAESSDGDQVAIDASGQAASELAAAFSILAGDVIANNDLELSSFGFGPVAPVTCYDGQVAGNTHSRVEIWVR